MLKKICYYPPKLIKKSKMRSKRGKGVLSSDPNFEIYQYYQQTAGNGVQTAVDQSASDRLNLTEVQE